MPEGASVRRSAASFALNGKGYVTTGAINVGTGRDADNYLKDFYRFDPSASAGSQWTVVNGFGGFKRYYASSFIINDEAYILCGLQ